MTISSVVPNAGTPTSNSVSATVSSGTNKGKGSGNGGGGVITNTGTSGYCTYQAYAPSTIGSIYGPLIDYGGGISCTYPYNLSEIVGLYNYDATAGNYIGTGYSTGASGNPSVGISATGYAPCYAPYSPGDWFESALLANINGGEYGDVWAQPEGCAQLAYST